MKLHRIAETFAGTTIVMTWCGRSVLPERIVRPEDVNSVRECGICKKAHDAALARFPEEVRVSATR